MHDLSSRLAGVVFERGDAGRTEELAGVNLAVVHDPDLVVGAATLEDVVEAVGYATRHGLAVRVQATGHGADLPVTDGLLLTTRRLDRVVIDGDVATIGAGVRWADVIAAAAPLGLAPVTGSSPTVGVVGYLLGGGFGPLTRSHGVSSDYVLGATVVTASGAVVDASPAGDADLYWALRGGKGGFGVVTEVRVRLVALPELYAGALTFDTPHVETALRGWIQWTADAPADVTTSVVLIRYPDLELLPPHLRGRFLLNLRFAFPGAAAEGDRLAAGLRALAPVEVDDVGPMALTDVARIHSDPTEPGPAWGWGALLTTIDDDFATALTSAFHPAAPVPFLAIEVRHLGGAATTDVDGGSAVGGREGAFAIHVVGAPDPALFAEVLPRAASGFAAEIAPWVAPFTTINYSARFADAAEFARAWPASTFERLAAVRRRVDPHGVFAYGVT